VVTVLIRTAREQTRVPGIVDSGADRTLLPLGVAGQLGIRDSLIKQDDSPSGASGAEFEAWRAPQTLEGRLMPRFAGGRRPWGPGFGLDPAFADTEQALFGRADFFTAFTITFSYHPALGRSFS
jgi:hypothetical protein